MADDTPSQPEPSPKPAPKKRGIYRPKNQLDGFLRFVLRGKYKYRRYELFTDYLVRARKHSPEEAKGIIAKYQTNGVRVVYQILQDELRAWMAIRRKERARKANTARWSKHKAQQRKNPEK